MRRIKHKPDSVKKSFIPCKRGCESIFRNDIPGCIKGRCGFHARLKNKFLKGLKWRCLGWSCALSLKNQDAKQTTKSKKRKKALENNERPQKPHGLTAIAGKIQNRVFRVQECSRKTKIENGLRSEDGQGLLIVWGGLLPEISLKNCVIGNKHADLRGFWAVSVVTNTHFSREKRVCQW